MAGHITILNLRINPTAEIGTVVFVVEGHRDEFLILQYIFCRLLGYKMAPRMPKHSELRFAELTSSGNNRIIILNTSSSNIKSLASAEEYIDNTYADLVFTHHIDIKNSPLFYIWDRDRQNNHADITSDFLARLTSPYEDEHSHEHGMLLLSYPALESMIVSCHEARDYLPDECGHIKDYVKDCKYQVNSISEEGILVATQRMMDTVREIIRADEYDIDGISSEMLRIFYSEEKIYKKTGKYRLLSLPMHALLWLGIVEIVE